MSDLFPMSHAGLCAIAVKWLKRDLSKKGPGCDVAVSEVKTGHNGETPDAIGWRRKDDERMTKGTDRSSLR
ncbi:hypothetical protein QC589_01575 [Halomonas elongata]|uniref:hypothetical protein n=1 Tax=Halomonas elongata TaxID=2746 RepID=UPI0033466C5A